MESSSKGAECVACKGRLWCGVSSCPLLDRVRIQAPKELVLKKDVFGPSPPSVFCGWHGYPNVFMGPLIAFDDAGAENASFCDNPAQWYGYNFAKIIELRSSLARGMSRQGVKARDGVVGELQAAVLSPKPVDMEVCFDSVPKFSLSFSAVSQPMGPSARMEKLDVVGNASVPRKIGSVVAEGLKVRDALPELMSTGFDYYYLQKLLCAGVLGQKQERKLVPTRWSITAADRMIADMHISVLKGLPELGEVRVYSNEYLYNHFEVLLLPGRWEFEQFEAWAPNTIWTEGQSAPHIAHEYEPFEGRSDYAESEGGGYYAGRFSVAEALATKLKRQARVVVFREIYEGYKLPVGVWSIREGIRRAFEDAPLRFNGVAEALKHLEIKLKYPLASYSSKSSILKQKKLTDF